MTRLRPWAAARCRTSMVAIMVTAMPVTRVSGLPALKVSTVSECQGTPTWDWISAMTSRAVGAEFCAGVKSGRSSRRTAMPQECFHDCERFLLAFIVASHGTDHHILRLAVEWENLRLHGA